MEGACKDGQFLGGGFLALQPHRPVCAAFGGKLRWEGAEERKWEGDWEGGDKEEGGNIGQKNR